MRVDAELATRLRIDEPELAHARQLLLARVADLDCDHVVAAGEVDQGATPVQGPAEVRDDHDERPLQRDRSGSVQRLREARRPGDAEGRLRVQRRQQPDQPGAALPRRQRPVLSAAERDDAEPVAAPRGDVADRDRDTFGHVRLAPVGRPEAHGRGRVEREPGHEHPLREVDPYVRLAGAGGDVPVHLAHVVADHVRPDLRELGALPEQRRAVVTGEEGVDTAADGDVQRAQERLGQRAGPGLRRRRRAPECMQPAHAALRPSWMCGVGTLAITASRMVSGLTSSASAWYVSTSRWRSASFASEVRSSTSA